MLFSQFETPTVVETGSFRSDLQRCAQTSIGILRWRELYTTAWPQAPACGPLVSSLMLRVGPLA